MIIIKHINDEEIKAIARHEIKITLEDIIIKASKLIENAGYFYIVHRPDRLADIITLLNKFNFGIKRIVNIYNSEKSKCILVLIESMFNGENYIKIEEPVFLNKYTSYQGIFGG